VPIYGFDQNGAKRIGETVRLVESRRVGTRSAGPAQVGRGSTGVRCMLGTMGTAAWSKDVRGKQSHCTQASLAVKRACNTLTAYNYFADIGTSSNTARWVSVSNNGFGWLLIAAECD
jgi:hypothetical protein